MPSDVWTDQLIDLKVAVEPHKPVNMNIEHWGETINRSIIVNT